MDLRRLLHGGQEYTFHGPPPAAGTELTVQTRVERDLREGRQARRRDDVRRDGHRVPRRGRDARGRGRVRPRSRPASRRPPRRVRDAELGRARTSAPRPTPREYGPLTRTDFVRYQGASGDFNPIHHDDEFAQSAGYPTVFSVGMLQAGILGELRDRLARRRATSASSGCSSASRCGRATGSCAPARSSTDRDESRRGPSTSSWSSTRVGGGAAIKG